MHLVRSYSHVSNEFIYLFPFSEAAAFAAPNILRRSHIEDVSIAIIHVVPFNGYLKVG